MSILRSETGGTVAPALWAATVAGLHDVASDRRPRFEGREVAAVSRDQDGWWAIVDGREVWHAEAGNNWVHMATADDVRLNCILPTRHGLLVGTAGAHLMRLEGGRLRLVEGFEAVDGRDTWYTPWGGPPDVRSLSADPTGALYANVHVGGIARSEDAGQSWLPTIDIHADVHDVQAAGGGLVLAATARGLAVSNDGGRTWEFVREGLHATYARAVGLSDGVVLLTVSQGPSGTRAAVYRRLVAGEDRFVKCVEGLPEWFEDNVDTGCLAASGPRVAIGTSDGDVFVSDDVGRSWSAVATGLPPIRQLEFAA